MRSAQVKGPILLSGRVVSGMGRSRHFMRQKGYRNQISRKLGINPYLGTLNIKVSGEGALVLDSIKQRKGILIKGFKKDGQTFGDVVCYKAEISGLDCAIVVPKLSTHKDVAEVLSSKKLRTALNLNDGSRIRASVFI